MGSDLRWFPDRYVGPQEAVLGRLQPDFSFTDCPIHDAIVQRGRRLCIAELREDLQILEINGFTRFFTSLNHQIDCPQTLLVEGFRRFGAFCSVFGRSALENELELSFCLLRIPHRSIEECIASDPTTIIILVAFEVDGHAVDKKELLFDLLVALTVSARGLLYPDARVGSW